jgi:hypothetical protein
MSALIIGLLGAIPTVFGLGDFGAGFDPRKGATAFVPLHLRVGLLAGMATAAAVT